MITDCKGICQLLQQVIPEYNRAMAKKFSGLSVTPSQAELLFFLEENGPQKISELAKKLNMVDSNVSNICSRLEKIGYITRIRQKNDQRVVKINLTSSAKNELITLREEELSFIEKMNGMITPDDIQDIMNGLEKLNYLLTRLNETVEQEEIIE